MAKAKRDYVREYAKQKERGAIPAKLERQKARREVDKKDTGSVTKLKKGKRVASKSPRRVGKDVSHNKALIKGGSNKDGYKLESPSKNRARNYQKKK